MSGAPLAGGALPCRRSIGAKHQGGAGKALCAVSAPARRAVGGNRMLFAARTYRVQGRIGGGGFLAAGATLASGLILHHAEAPIR